jgi:hypothetical protein
MRFFCLKILSVAALLLLNLATAANAQQAPTGSCLIPDVGWCWPVLSVPFGQRCECPGPNGTPLSGVML